MTEELKKKVEQSIKLLRSIPQDKGDVILAYSGGKDSDVCLELCKMAGIPFKAVYHNSTIDPPGTIKHCLDNSVIIKRSKKTFLRLIAEMGYPSRYARFCCKYLKEYYDGEICIQGIRASESKARAERYKEPEQCRVYDKKHKSRVYMPILFWTDEDVTEFVQERGIKCHALYYRGGYFDASQRLGCIGCPLASKRKRILQFKKYPKLVRQYIRYGQIWFDKHDNQNSKYRNAINKFVCDLFYDSDYNRFMEATNTLYGKTDWRKYLEDYFKIDLSDVEYK